MKEYICMKKKTIYFVIFMLFAFVLAGCGGTPENDWLQAPDWSRSQWVGNTSSADGSPFVIDDLTKQTFFFFSSPEESAVPYVRAFDEGMNLLWESNLTHQNSYAAQMQIELHDNLLSLFWIDSYKLYYASMTLEGKILQDATLLSGDLNVSRLDTVYVDGDYMIWFSGTKSHPGIYQLTSAENYQNPQLIAQDGYQPVFRKDAKDNIHAIYVSYGNGLTVPTIFYTSSINQSLGENRQEIARIQIPQTAIFYGPWFGIEDNQAYVFWSQKITTGMTAGTKDTKFISFSLDTLHKENPQDVFSPYEYNLPYDYESSSELITGNRFDMSLPTSIAGGYQSFDHMQTNKVHASELALIVETNIKYKWRNESFQSAILYYDEGQATSYQLLTFTSFNTRDALVTTDSNGYMHATWAENNSALGNTVYYASTNPTTIKNLGNLTWNDYQTMFVEVIFEILAGIAISPLVGAVYMIAPLLIIVITPFLRKFRNEKLSLLGTLITLGIAILVYESIKTATLPGYETFVPLSPWIRNISYTTGLFLQKAVPTVLFLFSALIAWSLTYYRKTKNAVNFIMLYVGINVVTSMMIYGLLFYYAA